MSPLGAGYEELVRQNWGFLSPEEQGRIAKTRVLLAGCGLGSAIAVLAARTGFCSFVLADGDTVEPSNLNRQAFRREHVGQNKAHATAALVKEVNPDAEVRAVPAFLQAKDASPLVAQCDVLVNMVDPGPTLLALQQAARVQGKVSLFPLNVGFGGLLLAFGPASPPVEELVSPATDGGLFLHLIERLLPSLPGYLAEHLWVAQRIQREGVPPPQLGIAASLSASLTVGAMVQIALGLSVPLAPAVLALDSREPSVLPWPLARQPAQTQEA